MEVTKLLKPLVQRSLWRLSERAGRNVSERRAGPENDNAGADPPGRGKAEVVGTVRANKFHQSCRGIGDGMRQGEHHATREAPAVIAVRTQPERPRGTGRAVWGGGEVRSTDEAG